MKLYKRNGRPYLDFGHVNGRRVRLSYGQLERLVREGNGSSAMVSRQLRLGDAAKKYIERCSRGGDTHRGVPKSLSMQAKDEFVLTRLIGRLGARRMVHTIGETDLQEYLAARRQEVSQVRGQRISVSTVNRDIAVLKTLFRFLVREKHCEASPAAEIRQPKEHNERSRVLTENELALWRAQLTGTPRDILDVLANTAMRVGEVLRLRPEHYDALRKELTIVGSKELRRVRLPVNSHVQSVLEARLGNEWLFAKPGGGAYRVSGIGSIFRRARKRSGIDHATVHDLRRTAATHMLTRGADVRSVQAVLRHSSLEMTQRYLGIQPASVRAAVEAVSGIGLGTPVAQTGSVVVT